MLVNTKAKIGVFSIALGAYLPQFPQLVPNFEAQYEDFKKTIPDTVDIVDGGMVSRKKMQRITKLSSSQLGTFQIISVRLVDNDAVCHFHNTALDTLQFVARTGKLDKQEKVHH